MASAADPFDEISDHLKCPICMEVPRNKVFQCQAGHPLCEDCYSQLTSCPQCRIPFGEVPIRTLLMETMLDDLGWECPYKSFGCDMKVGRKSLEAHSPSCSYNIPKFGPLVDICNKIGFGSCEFKMNRGKVADSIQHFGIAHGATVHNSDQLEIEFAGFSSFSGGSKLIILEMKEEGHSFLISVTHKGDESNKCLVWTPLYLGHTNPNLGEGRQTAASPYRVTCSLIGSQILQWNMFPQDIYAYSDDQASSVGSYSLDMPTTQFMNPDSGSVFAKVKLIRNEDFNTLSISKTLSTEDPRFIILTPFDMLPLSTKAVDEGNVNAVTLPKQNTEEARATNVREGNRLDMEKIGNVMVKANPPNSGEREDRWNDRLEWRKSRSREEDDKSLNQFLERRFRNLDPTGQGRASKSAVTKLVPKADISKK